jgi:flagellar basal-body rod protein FlgF|tara:strand:- start:7351 stop:8139 length:789 start_codon:yes stop_codon:yes gene_type:complete
MDRMVQTALNSMKMLMENQAATAHNLSNLSTPGFKQDIITDFSSLYLNRQEGLEPRIVAAREVGKFSVEQGMLDNTKNPLDLAINGEGYFVVLPDNGIPALSRRGDFNVNENGQLLDGAGNQVLDAGMQPLVIPAFREINITSQGEILIQPIGAAPGELAINAGALATFVPNEEAILKKSLDGNIRYEEILNADGTVEQTPIEPNQQAKLVPGFLEKSNVNAIEEMVNTIDQMRKFEMHVKLIQMAEELDSAGTSLMRLPGM